jgi:hypothetical protein
VIDPINGKEEIINQNTPCIVLQALWLPVSVPPKHVAAAYERERKSFFE